MNGITAQILYQFRNSPISHSHSPPRTKSRYFLCPIFIPTVNFLITTQNTLFQSNCSLSILSLGCSIHISSMLPGRSFKTKNPDHVSLKSCNFLGGYNSIFFFMKQNSLEFQEYLSFPIYPETSCHFIYFSTITLDKLLFVAIWVLLKLELKVRTWQ